MSLAKELSERGFINQSSSDDLGLVLDKENRVVYHGIDPTADSAHVGNMSVWVLLKHLKNAGHKIVFLVGGGTGMVGDPKPDAERQLRTIEEVSVNVEKIKTQAENFFGEEVEFVNNYDWLGKLNLIDFLRDVGKHFTVNELIKKDAIATRLQSETGLSYTEFAYPILQGYDYYQLFQSHNCTLQVGGSDQWGNMLAGVELIRRKLQKEAFVVTVPLIVDKATGKKFGKSEGNAVWLDSGKTSPYRFYQFWLNVSDESVIDHLKMFTFISLEEIEQIERDHQINPGIRVAQKRLASAVTELVHGRDSMLAAERVSAILFGGESFSSLNEKEQAMLLETAPSSEFKAGVLVDVLVEVGLATSKREARTFIESGAVEVAGIKVDDVEMVVEAGLAVSNLILLKRGKKNLHILKV
ncbi:tyrosine--tRNA ligase [Candidatus Kaiserbacteria bacterium]|nr:tyrosine--tRNA ligase [Candidatus Kaiserbacteria bacterium]